VDPARLRFTQVHLDRAKEEAIVGSRALEGFIEQAYASLLRSQPTPEPSDFAEILRKILSRPDVRRTLGMEN
jgi:hypothetical protein